MHGLKRILDRLGLKQAEFARLLGVSARTVSLWATGEVALPGPVKAYLRLLQTAPPDTRALEIARLAGPHAALDEGLYSLSYGLPETNRADPGRPAPPSCVAGEALAVFRSGRVVGSDLWGGKFEGTYRFDTARRTNHFHIRLRVPPDGELVTGLSAGSEGATVEIEAEFEPAGPITTAVVDIAGRPVGLTLAYLGPLPL
jgi:transcriptional regulator with XRE-family HTH domain